MPKLPQLANYIPVVRQYKPFNVISRAWSRRTLQYLIVCQWPKGIEILSLRNNLLYNTCNYIVFSQFLFKGFMLYAWHFLG